jgi:hypothetical protein
LKTQKNRLSQARNFFLHQAALSLERFLVSATSDAKLPGATTQLILQRADTPDQEALV